MDSNIKIRNAMLKNLQATVLDQAADATRIAFGSSHSLAVEQFYFGKAAALREVASFLGTMVTISENETGE